MSDEKMMSVEVTAEEAQKVINSQRREIGVLKGRLQRAWTQTHYMDNKYSGSYLSPAQIDGAIKHLKDLLHLAECGNPEYNEEELEALIKTYEDVKKDKDYNAYRGLRVSFFDFRLLFVLMDYDERKARQQVDSMETLRKFLLRENEQVPPNHWFSGPGDKEWMP